VYGMLNSRATYEGLRAIAPDQRPFVLTRASAAGGQRYAATWTGDNASTWAHLRLSTRQLVNLGLSGFAYAGDDIGGFAGPAPSAELLTRWIEVGAFNPIFRDHYEKGKPPQEPWVHGPEQEDIRRHYIEERYRLMPYLYALAEESSRTGMPILRPVFLEYPEVLGRDGSPGNATDDQFLLGPDLLVAPSSAMESPAAYKVRLPGKGGWYDYWTGKRVDSDLLTIVPRLDLLPVFVRAGAILPRQPLVQSTGETPAGNLELHVYPGPDCHGELYLDDGVSFAYQRGDFLRQALQCSVGEGEITVRFGAREGSFAPWWKRVTVLVHGWSAPGAQASLEAAGLSTSVDAAAQTVRLELADPARAATLRITTR